MAGLNARMLDSKSGHEIEKSGRTPNLHASWLSVLGDEFDREHMGALRAFLKTELQSGAKVFPRPAEYFAALDATPFESVRVVILGQDPYHGAGQAHGLCFSVRDGVAFPPSLLNIFKELESDVAVKRPQSGNLSTWSKRGILLLNSVLTVREGQAASHQGRGWEKFTDRVIRELSEKRSGLVFVLWGAYAQKKGAVIDRSKHFVIECVHPSPLSAHRGFFGSKPFSKINSYLTSRGEAPIDWSL